jgi:general secretion pathway protein M
MKTLETLQARWNTLAHRERLLLQTAAAVLMVCIVWFFALGPSLSTLRNADAQHQALNAQLQHMLTLQAQAREMQSQPALGFDEAVRALQATTKQTLPSSAQVQVTGSQATVTLRGATADALAQWLAQARLNARSTPIEAHLVRANAATSETTSWNGTLVMGLPGR